MIDSDDLYGPMEVDDDLSTALDSKTLVDRDVVPFGLHNNLGSSADALPVMSAECERIFSSAKKLIIQERNALVDNAIKGYEYLKSWRIKALLQGNTMSKEG
jgi:hypothetical protein